MRRLFFHEESIHEVSRRYLEHEYVRTYGQAETNMPPHFFKVGGIKNVGGGEGEGQYLNQKHSLGIQKRKRRKK